MYSNTILKFFLEGYFFRSIQFKNFKHLPLRYPFISPQLYLLMRKFICSNRVSATYLQHTRVEGNCPRLLRQRRPAPPGTALRVASGSPQMSPSLHQTTRAQAAEPASLTDTICWPWNAAGTHPVSVAANAKCHWTRSNAAMLETATFFARMTTSGKFF